MFQMILLQFNNIKIDHDLVRLKRRYMKRTKSVLADMVIRLQQCTNIEGGNNGKHS